MENFKKVSCFLVLFSLIFQESSCGPFGNFDGGENDIRNLLRLLFTGFSEPVIEKKPTVTKHFTVVNHGNYAPISKSKFNPGHDNANLNYADYFTDYEDEHRNSEDNINGRFIAPWLKIDYQKNSKTAENNRNENDFKDFGSNEDYDSSQEDYENNSDQADFHQFNYKNYDPYRCNVVHNRGFHHHPFGHNHGFHHEHTPGCNFPYGDRPGRRRPRPPPPPPGPPPTAPPTVVPTTTNPPTVAPTTSTSTPPSIDPRASTVVGIISTQVPSIDIRFGRRRRGIRNDKAKIYSE